MYAADPSSTPGKEGCARADVINMSFGATFIPEKGDKPLLKALDKATTFADKHGVLLVAAGGNDGISLDQFKKAVSIPAMSARVLGVSATGPVGFALGATNFSRIGVLYQLRESPGMILLLPAATGYCPAMTCARLRRSSHPASSSISCSAPAGFAGQCRLLLCDRNQRRRSLMSWASRRSSSRSMAAT